MSARSVFLSTIALAPIAVSAAGPLPAAGDSGASLDGGGPADRLVASVGEEPLRRLLLETLVRSPAIAAAGARARAAAQRAPQARSLPHPVAGVTAFVAPPETRVGPQRLTASYSQGLPWLGKLRLREQAALAAAVGLEHEVEARRLAAVTAIRRLYRELAFQEELRRITRTFREHLVQHEEISRARYSTGVGVAQGVVKLQAEITSVDRRLLEIEERTAALVARINTLRDRPPGSGLGPAALPELTEPLLDPLALLAIALESRPELAAADAGVAEAEARVRLAETAKRPDFRLGLAYTLVEPRDDPAARLQPPSGDGDDILALHAAVTLPVRRKSREAELEEAVEAQQAAAESRRRVVAEIQGAIDDLTRRIPLAWRQARLLEEQLIVQAREALESATAGYVAGTLNALDLLDAEHVLFEAQAAAARSRADFAIGIAELEGAVGDPLASDREGRP